MFALTSKADIGLRVCYRPAGDRRLGNQYNPTASLGELGKLLELRFDP